MDPSRQMSWPLFVTLLIGLVLIAIALRLWGIDLRSITHPEIYVPGIPLIEGISEPPPRYDFLSTLWWHYHDEPHPMGWYLAMMGWTEMFGTSHTALRLPSALFGAASVVLIALIGHRIWGPWVGLLAASLLCLHGFHLYWSQNARMYTAGMFLGLLSTWLLLRLFYNDRNRPGLEIAYVLSVVAGVQTVELFWPIIVLQTGWVALMAPGMGWRGLRQSVTQGPRLLQVQAMALMMAVPALVHSVYRARGGAAGDPELIFLIDYAAFGFLFTPDNFAIPSLAIPSLALLGLAGLWLILTFLGTNLPSLNALRPDSDHPALPVWLPVIIAVLMAGLVLWMGSIAYRRSQVLMLFAVLPLMALALPTVALLGRMILRKLLPALDRLIQTIAPVPLLLALYVILAPLVLYVASYKMSVLAPRALMILLPYQLLLAGAGLVLLARHMHAIGIGVGLVLLVGFVLSIPYAWQKPGSPRDYRGLYEAMAPEMMPGDLVFMRKKNWADTPFFYYLKDAAFVVENWRSALTANPDARVWLITWPYEEMPVIEGPRRDALSGYTRISHIQKLRAEAELFVPESLQ